MSESKTPVHPDEEQDADLAKPHDESAKPDSVPVVGIGASAGGLKAFEAFFDHLSPNPNMAFVLVQHLDPHHESELPELLQNHTGMDVDQVKDQTPVRANCVYVIPPGKSLVLREGTLHLSEPEQPHGRRAPIDRFFRSLASDQAEKGVCIILSGTGSDGTLGLKSVKEQGGVVMAQDPGDAEYDGMPRSAIATGLVDLVAPAPELARRLLDYYKNADRIRLPEAEEPLPEDDSEALQRILAQLQSHTGHDFSHYKRSSVQRRLERRMQVNGTDDLSSYLDLLRHSAGEGDALLKDLLISVTNFFREPETFEVLEKEVIPRLFEGKGRSDRVRVWVAGCATGEEAYSIAMLLQEEAFRRENAPDLSVFATDLDVSSIQVARQGLYPEAIAADVPPERLERFFSREAEGYRVRKELQEIILFANHNLIKDPPFIHLDLISCRNLLIYLKRDTQGQVFRIFHYALNPGGYLFLGSSETAEGASELFQTARKRHRIYRRRETPASLPQLPMAGPDLPEAERKVAGKRDAGPVDLGEIHRDAMLGLFAPPSVLVDADYRMRYLFGDLGPFLRRYEGHPTDHLLENVQRELAIGLRTALFTLFRRGQVPKPRYLRLSGEDGAGRHVRLRVEPVERDGLRESMALVIFETVSDPVQATEAAGAGYEDQAVAQQLEQELQDTRHRLQTVVEEYETSNEELKASNEELQATNEELRSTTEELETSREELRSTNEELLSVNQELRIKVQEVDRANSDLENLMEETDIATLFLDRQLCLKRYTPRATELFHLISGDVGRPFRHVAHEIDEDQLGRGSLHELAQQVLERLKTVEETVRSLDGRSFLMRMRPYRTVDDRIDGVVITLVDVTAQVQVEQQERRFGMKQAVLAELGEVALQGTAPEDLLQLAVRQVAACLEVPVCHVWMVEPEGDTLRLAAAVGWAQGAAGTLTVPLERDSQPGYTLEVQRPVVMVDRDQERRFDLGEPIAAMDVRSGVSAIIPGPEHAFGVLEAYGPEPKAFGEQRVSFLQAVANVLGTAQERREAEQRREALLARVVAERSHLHRLFDQAPALITMHRGPDHIYTFSNAWNNRLLGGREVVGKPLLEALPELADQELKERFDRVYETGEPDVRREVAVRFDRDGDGVVETAYFDQVYRPIWDGSGHIEGVMGFAFEVTGQVLARQRIEQERRLMETVLQQMPAGVIIAEAPAGRLLMGNDKVEEIWRAPYRPSGDIEGYRVYKGFHADGTPLEPQEWPLARAIATGEEVHDEEIPFERGDGTCGVVLNNAAPIYDQEGRITAAVVVFQDVTDRKQAEAERERLLAELQTLTETLEQRVAARTAQTRMLASALSVAEARERERLARVLHDDLQQLLYSELIRLEMLVAGLEQDKPLNFRELVTGMKELMHRAVDVTRALVTQMNAPAVASDRVGEAVEWLAQQMKELHGLEVTITGDGAVRMASRERRALLLELIRELLFNIVKHAGVKQARVMLEQKDGMLVVRVEDDGTGFDVTAVQGQDAVPPQLGLFSVAQRLQVIGGQLEIESTPGDGTLVSMAMPIR